MNIDEIKSQNVISDLGPNLKIAFIIGTAIVSPITSNQNTEFDENIPFTQEVYEGQDIQSNIVSTLDMSNQTFEFEKVFIIQKFAQKITANIEELNSDIIELVDDNFWELG